MKTLLVLRHAKSSWDDLALDDHDRPLNQRGKRDAPRMGRLLVDEDLVPELILTSTATRARKTAKATAKAAGFTGRIMRDSTLYLHGPGAFITLLRTAPSEVARVMVVGHNPDLEELIQLLAGATTRMPTAALAHLQLPISAWHELAPDRRAVLLHLWLPRTLTS